MTTTKNTETGGDREAPPVIEAPAVEELLDRDDAPDFTPEPEAVPVTTDVDVWRRMELEDERQIMDELQGRALDVMIYSFEQDGKPATGFSWKGSRETVRTMNARGWTGIRTSPTIAPRVEQIENSQGEAAYRVTVYAEDTKSGGGNWGIAEQSTVMHLKSGRTKKDPFAVHKALSKAQRNAFEPLIPLEVVEYLKAQYLGTGAVKVIPGAGAPEVDAPPPLDDEEAKGLLDECEEIYDQIKALDRLVMPPGAFANQIKAAQHSHDRLRQVRDALQSFLEGERDLHARREEYRALVAPEKYQREVEKMRGMSQQRRLGVLAGLIEEAEAAKAEGGSA